RDINRLVRRDNQIWYLSKISGLWMSDGLKLTHFNQADSTIHTNLNDICFDDSGHAFIASNSGEVYIAAFDGVRLEILHRIGQKEGLRGSTANWLVRQGGYLWIGTNLGLHCLDLDHLFKHNEYRIRFFDKEDGYFGQGSKRAVINQGGQLFVASGNRLIEIGTSKLLKEYNINYPLIISNFIVNPEGKNERRIEGKALGKPADQGKIRLKYTERNLDISYDLLNYANPGKDLFRFQLSGYDQEWSSWSARRRANYTNLPSGRYEFTLESINQGTLKSSGPITVSFYIVTPFWRRWSFLVIVFIMILAATILITRQLVDRKRRGQIRRAEVESRILQLEMQALQAQMNPHFIYNCLGGIQYSVLENRNEQVLDYINDFSNVLRVSLENASQGTIRFGREVDFLHSYLRLEQMRFPEAFEYEIRTGNVSDNQVLYIPSMMIQPFAENSIKHGFRKVDRRGTLLIEFEMKGEDVIRCTITDNGIGRAQSRPKPPVAGADREHSTTIAEKRLQLYNQQGRPKKFGVYYTDLFENGEPAGLKVELLLPVSLGEFFKRVVNS
ncbi:MAG: histidine kinase, partial [Bacteroidales bacterium]